MYCRLINTFGLCIHRRVIPENLRITIRVGTGRVMSKAKRSWRSWDVRLVRVRVCPTHVISLLQYWYHHQLDTPASPSSLASPPPPFCLCPPSPLALLLLCPLQVFVRLASKHADVIRHCRPHHKCPPPPLRLPVTSCHARRARYLASLPLLVSRPSLDTHLTVYRFILPSSVSFLYISFVLDPSSFPWLSLDLLATGYQTSPHFFDLAPAVAHRHSIHT